MADKLSRKSTTDSAARNPLLSFKNRDLPKSLKSFKDWTTHPTEDWTLPIQVADAV